MRSLILTLNHLPEHELSPNARAHWSIKAQAARIARAESGWLAKSQWHDSKPMMLAEISYQFMCKLSRNRDHDNLVAACKSFQDGLIDAGVIAFDDSKHLTLGRVDVLPGDTDQTIITVTER